MKNNDLRVKLGCYATNVSMSVIGNLSPVLFLTFRSLYNISFSLLGLLVLINFVTQLIVDLIFSFFSHRINAHAAVKMTPVLTIIGLLVYALWPFVFKNSVYVGLVIGSIIFSASSGLSEVLMSSVVAALPSDNPEREMSKLHSIYAWGVVGVILISTLFLLIFKRENWQWLALFFTIVPLTAAVLFFGARLPELETPEKASGAGKMLRNKDLLLCVLAIFLGGASECTMSQWSSSYLEQALGIPKIWGDIFGVALFAVMLGIGRTLYAKRGKNIEKTLFYGACGAAVCYLTASLVNVPVIGLVACALTGLCVSMLWPGTLIVAADRFPKGGVFIYAIMAAGGDLGASVSPQLVGIVADAVSASGWAQSLSQSIALTPDQIGMKAGLLVGSLFAIAAIFVFLYVLVSKRKYSDANRLLNE